MPRDLTCRDVVELVTAYLEEALDADVRGRFEAHLARCDGCQAYLAQMRDTVRATGHLREEDVDPAMLEELRAAFRSATRGTPR